MDLRELGTILREERERQGLTIEDVSDKIKITRSCLTAIEEGNQSVLPHPVYAKGFIKNYARLLGVDQEEFNRRLSQVYQPEEPVVGNVSLIKDIPEDDCGCAVKPASKVPLVPALLCLVAFLAVAGLGWYLFAHVLAKSGDETESAAPQATAKPAAPPLASESEPARPVPVVPRPAEQAPPPQTPAPAAETPAPVAPPAPKAEATTLPEPSAEDRATQDIATSGPSAPAAPAIPVAPEPAAPAPSAKAFTVGEHGPHTVTIVANDRCWLQAGADGGTMHETMLEKGDTFTGRFADYLLVRLGNAPGVEIRFDNKLYPFQAGKGSVKTLKFVAKKTPDEAAQAVPGAPAPSQAPAVPTTPVAPAATAPALGGEAVPGAGAKEVEIYGQDGSWVIVNPDKGPSKEIYVKKGQRLTVPFSEKIEIKLGNPSSVIFRYDGKETPVVTEKGAVKTIRFP
ncbi:transcriptional regulator, XRE family [Solidesulfovibrio carbinoliphilus subsp. oakridgensis]|uniref:Transcriptional regulator, XRE family n=1 Tax=Solidesulfovibrio carbinoliphilus subsp. oakridgensis TaxID=694327 RepID=G7Q3W0_9BACT|nr:RodZ domain-containing protein [Solidesulfovibrio carbinoliphilus]EHJ46750.1 transcriptional regulator, XRE family [Solidesulfovibrio carbinoliphilus subsp. oakridgensis]